MYKTNFDEGDFILLDTPYSFSRTWPLRPYWKESREAGLRA
jgi:hypothetical protein